MPKYLLDSDVIIWCLRGEERWMSLVRELRRRGRLCCSVISLLEVEAGRRLGEERIVEDFMSRLQMCDVDMHLARVAGGFSRDIRAHGITLDVPDLAIAATAAVHGLELVTANPRHFPMEGVRVYGGATDEG